MKLTRILALALAAVTLAALLVTGCGDDGLDGSGGIAEEATDYDVTVSVTNAVGSLGALQFEVIYDAPGSGWRGSGGGVHCRWAVGSGLRTCNDAGSGRLRCALVELAGIATPSEVVTCTLASIGDVDLDLLQIDVVDASSPEFELANPSMAVTSVEVSTARDPSDYEDYDVTVAITNDVGLVGALQFEVLALPLDTFWRGAGGAVECEWLLPARMAELATCNDTGSGRLICAVVDIDGFATPTEVVRCTLASRHQPGVAGLAIDLRDTSSPEFEPLVVDLEIVSIEPR